jgi:hypothetical protein
MITGDGIWKSAALIPDTNNKIKSTVYEGAKPIKPMEMAVIAGVKITKYFAPVFSIIRPKNGLNRAGILLAISKKALTDKDIPCFSIKRGSNGAKNDEYISLIRCADETVITVDLLNFLLLMISRYSLLLLIIFIAWLPDRP